MEDTLIGLLQHAQSTRSSIWTFYIVIITTAFGVAFTDAYRALDTWIKVMLSIAVGASVWYNFFALVGNSRHIYEIVTLIQQEMPSSNPIYVLFENPRRYGGGSHMEIHAVYIPVNLAIGVAMWWSEIEDYLAKKSAWFHARSRSMR